MNPKNIFIALSLLGTGLIIFLATIHVSWLWLFILVGPTILLGIWDLFQTKHTILRNYPVVGHLRYFLESFRPEISQYFIETDTEGRPINRLNRSLIYTRAKKTIDTTPFGTQLDVYEHGYEWMDHSIYSLGHEHFEKGHRIMIGGTECKQPYASSILNISAMSFGSLSRNAVLAMNKGAQIGGFAQNTGEGGISPYHLEPGGDLIWQIGTGYFGCRAKDGSFSPELFKEKMLYPSVKMVEVKISQGAKPGHGGILPAVKNTKEIAGIRGVEPHTDVLSPPMHTAFSDAEGLLRFIQQLRILSDGKPIGFKLCIGVHSEFEDICNAMVRTGIKPDFISIDGGEGGTGAAPIEFSNSLGMPLRDGLAFAIDMLNGYDLKKDIKVLASGRVFNGFDIARLIALGADVVCSARAMMLATGCIQSLQCNRNTCPTGVATQNPRLIRGLVVSDKAVRVANYHEETVKSFVDLMAAAGIAHPEKLSRKHINRKVEMNQVQKYSEIYPDVAAGQFLN